MEMMNSTYSYIHRLEDRANILEKTLLEVFDVWTHEYEFRGLSEDAFAIYVRISALVNKPIPGSED
jgi:hypothetical protein